MAAKEFKLNRIVSLCSATGFWIKMSVLNAGEAKEEFLPLAFWAAVELTCPDGLVAEKVVPVTANDVPYVTNRKNDFHEMSEVLGCEVYHESEFELVGQKLKTYD